MKKASKNTNAKRGASKRTMWIIMAVVLIPAAIIFWNIAGRPLSAQASMKRYLEDKYKERFEVGYPSVSGGGLGIEGAWGADAHPVNNKNLTFRIIKAENRDSFSDQYTAKIWSQRETARLNKIAQQNASSSKWKVNASVEIYLAEPLSDTALPDNPKVEEIIKQESGPAYDVNLSYYELQNISYDDVVRDMERITNSIMNEGVKNVNYNYSVTNRQGITKKCKVTYDKPFEHLHNNIKNCLK
jgi:hypothetical protein